MFVLLNVLYCMLIYKTDIFRSLLVVMFIRQIQVTLYLLLLNWRRQIWRKIGDWSWTMALLIHSVRYNVLNSL